MLFSDINPYVRYARYMNISHDSTYASVVAYDARLFYCKSGSGTIMADGTEYNLEKGAVLVINSGIRYRICAPEKRVVYIVLNFDYTQDYSYLNTPIPPKSSEIYDFSDERERCSFSDASSFDRVFYISRSENVEDELATVVDEYNHRFIHHHTLTGALTAVCLARCARMENDGNEYNESRVFDKIISYIHHNYNKSVTNIEIGEKFGYHPNYISSIIKTNTGMPLHKYLIHIRLNRAVEMLEDGAKSVSDIAHECGFCDVAYFSGYFKKHFGISPTKYRGV